MWGGQRTIIIFGVVLLALIVIYLAQYLSDTAERYMGQGGPKNQVRQFSIPKTTTSNSFDQLFNEATCTTSTVHEPCSIEHILRTTKGRSKGEKICRWHLEKIYSKPFPSCYPKFLENPETGRLELDGYNEELGIAFEYNGKQHYERVHHWQSEEDFLYQLKKDRIKKKRCQENGVYLITVPYTVPHEEIRHCLEFNMPENVAHRKRLMKMGYQVPLEYIPIKNRI